MSSDDDQKESGPVWEDSVHERWERPQSQSSLDEDGAPFFSGSQQMEAIFSAQDEEELLARDVDDLAPPDSPLQQVWYYTRFLLIPCLLAGITMLLTLPSIATGQAQLPPAMFWPIFVIILVIAGLHAGGIYYTNVHPNMWILITIASFLLLALLGTFAVFGPLAGAILLAAALLLCFYLIRSIFHPVPEGFVDIVYAQGNYQRTLSSGFQLLLPWERVVAQVSIKETLWSCPPQRVQLSSDDDVNLRAQISYQILPEDAYLAITQVNDWETSLRELATTLLQKVAATFAPGDFIPWSESRHAYQSRDKQASDDFIADPMRRDQINSDLHMLLSDQSAPWGVQINRVEIHEIQIIPHSIPILDTDIVMDEYPDTDALVLSPSSTSDAPTEVLPAETLVPILAATQNSSPVEVPRSSPPPPPVNPAALKEDVLVRAYEQVKSGKITDPMAIRQIAAYFEAVARNQEASETVSFDPERAAQNLYAQAQKFEEHARSGSVS